MPDEVRAGGVGRADALGHAHDEDGGDVLTDALRSVDRSTRLDLAEHAEDRRPVDVDQR